MKAEEKARAYDEVLEKARKLRNEYNEIEGCYSNQWLCEELFPELAESEDERIRKAILEHFKHKCAPVTFSGVIVEKAIAWLEKQGEQKPVEWSEDYEKMLNNCIGAIYAADYYDLDDKNEMENWLKSLRPQQGVELSNTDKEVLSQAVCVLKANFEPDEKFDDCDYDCKHLTDKLLGIKNRQYTNSWKPSEEQIKALEHFVRSIGESGYISSYDRHTKTIYSLLDDLKKL